MTQSAHPLNSVTLRTDYSSGRDNLVKDFFTPCLSGSKNYDRAVGFFRASVLALVEEPVVEFVNRGGKIRIICSSDLPQDHVDVALDAYRTRSASEVVDFWVPILKETGIGSTALSFFSSLIAIGSLDLKIAISTIGSGIFHDKVGIFSDGLGNSVSFRGSSNESFSGWDSRGNHESFDVFNSWSDQSERERVEIHKQIFDRLWADNAAGLEVLPLPEAARRELLKEADPEGYESAFRKFEKERSGASPNGDDRKPQAHQEEAIEAWKAAGNRGILAHATGSGKTFTALMAIKTWIANNDPVLILVPSSRLLSQWSEELENMEATVLMAGGGHTTWRRPNLLESFVAKGGRPRIVLSTVQTASSEDFIKRVRSSMADSLLVVADEMHWMGAPKISELLSVDAGARLGLSATPTRYGDPDGTSSLLEYFSGVVHEFSLADAVAAGRLCKYNYSVRFAELTDPELEEWDLLTKQISRDYARENAGNLNSPSEMSDRAKMLLIRRARIVKNAAEKVSIATNILLKTYKPGDHWLVYCDNQVQMEDIQRELTKNALDSDSYHSEMLGDKEATLQRFDLKGGILVSIKCLDEGVDIPSADHALIIASSQNPREFIQRRGRVLRTSENKHFADIHDVLVTPPTDDGSDSISRLSIIRAELARATEFAASAQNLAVRHDLLEMASNYAIEDLETTLNFGFESEETEDDEQ